MKMKWIFVISAIIATVCMAFLLIFSKGRSDNARSFESQYPTVDTLKNAEKYYSLHPRMQQAFEFLNNIDLDTLSPGRYEIDGDNMYITVSMSPLKDKEEALLEVHNAYIDIQLALGGDTESFGWAPRYHVADTIGVFDIARDIQFFRDLPQVYFPLHQGMFTIFMPEDAHAPQIGTGEVKKAVVKVRK